jgi:hypothetical protein
MATRVPDGDRLACYGVSFGAAQRGTATHAMGGRSCRFECGGETRLWPTWRSYWGARAAGQSPARCRPGSVTVTASCNSRLGAVVLGDQPLAGQVEGGGWLARQGQAPRRARCASAVRACGPTGLAGSPRGRSHRPSGALALIGLVPCRAATRATCSTRTTP